jgi:mannitol-specific phosphotransferase system IIBC component
VLQAARSKSGHLETAGAAAPSSVANYTATAPVSFSRKRVQMSQSISAAEVKTIIFACEAGMGSSLMSVNSLKKKLKAAQITDVVVVHKPAREIPADAQVVVVHKGLAKTAKAKAPNAVVVAFNHFLNDPVFDKLVKSLVDKTEINTTEA